MEELAKALRENDWVPSKTTDKTMAVMSGLSNIEWDKVKLFTLRWQVVGGEIVPNVNLMMFGEGEKEVIEGDIKVELPEEIQSKLDSKKEVKEE